MSLLEAPVSSVAAPLSSEGLALLRTFTRAFRKHRVFALDPVFAKLLTLLWRRCCAGGLRHSHPAAEDPAAEDPVVFAQASSPLPEDGHARSAEVRAKVRAAPAAYVALLTAARVLCRDSKLVDGLDVTEVDVGGVLQLLRVALELRNAAAADSLQRTASGRLRRRTGSASSERVASGRRSAAAPVTKQEVYLTMVEEGMYLLQKLALQPMHRATLVRAGAVPATLAALSKAGPALLHRASLRLAIALSQSGDAREQYCDSGVPSMALALLESSASPVRWEAASLMAELCRCQVGRDSAAMMGAVRTCADILGNEREQPLHLPAAQVLENLSVDHSDKLRSSGCLPLLAMHLASGFELLPLQPKSEQALRADRASADGQGTPASSRPSTELQRLEAQMEAAVAQKARSRNLSGATGGKGGDPAAPERWNADMRRIEQQRPLLTTVCAAMTSLARFDVNAVQLQECNVIFQAGRYVALAGASKDLRAVQLYAIRLLRFLFSLERNRRHFKRMFPPQLFAAFIDVGHYEFDQKKYRPLVDALNALTDAERRRLRQAIMVRRSGG